MDKREPDDPSPYLLAIWTPGKHKNCDFQWFQQQLNEFQTTCTVFRELSTVGACCKASGVLI